MGSITFDGYWTVVNIGERNTYDLLTWVPGPFTITFDGDTLFVGTPLNDFTQWYQAYADMAGQTGILVTDSEFGGTAILYSNVNNVVAAANEVVSVVVQHSNFICLLSGTRISTPDGERSVESLRRGDHVLTPEGESVAIRWIGRQSAPSMFAGPESIPVLIRAGALADGVPVRDLCVSPDHAVFVDGYLANARALVNGVTILPMPDPPEVIQYFHLELDRHRLVIADGTPVESFVDDVSRAAFDNVDEWDALGLDPLPVDSLPYVKVKSARQLPAVVSHRLTERATRYVDAFALTSS
jgi:hypothetical protein